MTVTDFNRGDFPFVYLGVLVGPEKQQDRHFHHIIDRIAQGTSGWHSKLLSSASRLVLIRHVLSSIPIHVISATSIPEECLWEIESILSNFFGGSLEYGRRRHWCKWASIYLPVEEGGLGIRNLWDVCKAIILKNCWIVSTSDSLWAHFMHGKCHIPRSPVFWKGPQWCLPEWKELVETRLLFACRCGWTIREGDVSFWFDNWNKEFSYNDLVMDGLSTKMLRDFWDGDQWCFKELVLPLVMILSNTPLSMPRRFPRM